MEYGCLEHEHSLAEQQESRLVPPLPALTRDRGHSKKYPLMKIRGLRWWIVALLFGAAVLNYVDRQTLSALAPTIQTDLGMDDRDYANIVNIFLLAYTIAYLLSGRLVDTMGTRLGMSVFVVW